MTYYKGLQKRKIPADSMGWKSLELIHMKNKENKRQ